MIKTYFIQKITFIKSKAHVSNVPRSNKEEGCEFDSKEEAEKI